LIIIRPDTVSQVLLIMIFSALLLAVFTAICACRNNRANAQPWIGAAIEQLIYSKLFIVGAPLGWLWAYIPIFMLGIMHGKEQAALLGSIRGISNMANVLMEQIETKVVADWARIRHRNGLLALEEAASRMLKIGVIYWLVGMSMILVFGRGIVNLLLGSLYAPHWNLLVIGWIGYGIYFVARIIGIKHRTLGFNQIEFVGNMFGVVAAVLAGIVMIPALSATGAAWVYVVVAVAMVGAQAYLSKRLVRQ
jgi:O-antigen/teichoic acid export membrane protein